VARLAVSRRRNVLRVPPRLAALVGLGILAVACSRPGEESRIRGIVIVDVDTLRADALGCYGNELGTSPAIDAFAAGATRFEWAFSQAPYTLPSQVSIFTSLYPWTHRVLRNEDRLGGDALTLAEVFSRAGWRTGAFVDGGFLKALFGLDQGFETYVDANGGGLDAMEGDIAAWLGDARKQRFLLLVHTYDVHSPYSPDEPFRSRFAALAPRPSEGFEPTNEVLDAIRESQWKPPLRQLPANDLEYARAMYLAEVAGVDAWFGRLLAGLRDLGLEESTAVVVVSDHGEEFQEHGSVLHDKLYTTVTHVPLLVSAPGSPASLVRSQVETIDLFPTLVELAGLEPVPGLEGRSLADSIRSGDEPAPATAFGMSPYYGDQRFAADAARQVVLTLSPPRLELFAYRDDPSGLRDLAAAEAPRAESLAREIRRRARHGAAQSPLRDDVELDEDAIRQLRALGYLD